MCINDNNPSCLKTSTCMKKTFTGLLTNFVSFTSLSYKVGLTLTLVDRTYKMDNCLLSFNSDIKKLTHILKKNQYPKYLLNRVVRTYLDNNCNSVPSNKNNTLYFKLPYLPLSNFAQRKVRTLVKRYCSNLKIRLAVSSFKIKIRIKVKDSVPRLLRYCVVTNLHVRDVIWYILLKYANTFPLEFMKILLQIKIRTYITIYKAQTLVTILQMAVMYSTKTYHQLKIKEVLHILWEGPNLYNQSQHYNLPRTV